jgi:hypothetical protein
MLTRGRCGVADLQLSQLINQLIALKKKHGDLPVYAGDPDYSGGDFYPVSACVYHDGQLEYNAGRWLVCDVTGKPHIDLYHFLGSHCSQCGRGCD